MATKKEFTTKRPTYLSAWYRDNLPDSSSGLLITDIDWLFFNHITKRFMLIEEKTNGAQVAFPQSKIFTFLHNVILEGIKNNADYQYMGFHTIVFENTTFENGKCYWDNEEITADELIAKLSI